MLRYLRLHFLRYDVLVLAVTAAVILLWPSLLTNLFNSDYMPHGGCYLWTSSLVWLHVSSDTVIGLSYVAIAFTLAYLVHRVRRDIPFSWMFLAFGLFIIACGMTHLMGVWTVWSATYWLSGSVKLVTAVASVATAVALPPLVPKVRDLVRADKISEQRRLELESANQDLGTVYGKLQELDQLKSDFFANVSHELRTPLALILGPAERLLAEGPDDDRARQDLAVIDRNARALLKMVDDLLSLSKLDAGRMELAEAEVDLARLVRLTVGNFEAVADGQGVVLSVDAPEHLQATVDPEKIQRVLLNLVSNALKHTPRDGVVRVVVADAEDGVRITVRDSGPGVPPGMREAVFDRFRTADSGSDPRFGGTGLGLAIAREMAELHGGILTVGDAPEGGAAFELSLPRDPAEGTVERGVPEPAEPEEPSESAAAAEPGPAPSEAPVEAPVQPSPAEAPTEADPPALEPSEQPGAARPRPLALVVEDNREMSRFLAQGLEESYRVARAYDGAEGLEKAVALRPDVVLTDVMMPEMQGDELVRRIRARPELDSVPIVVLTAKADQDLRIELLRQGAHDYLVKPFSMAELRTRVDNLVRVKRSLEILQESLEIHSRDIEELVGRLVQRNGELRAARRSAEEANRLKDDFLAIVSHELRTPLNAILGWSTVLQERPAEEALREQGLTTIERNAQAQAKIIDDLLDVSRIVSGRFRLDVQPVDLGELALEGLEAVRPAAQAKGIRLRSEIEPGAGVVPGDPSRLHQVAWNLLSNAVKFTPGGGRVVVRVRRANGSMELSVSDTGQGMSREFLPRAFDRFRQEDSSTTREHGGLGLGLAIVRHLVELHGGSVYASSPGPGKGSTLTVHLPLQGARSSATAGNGRPAPPGPG